MKPQKIIAFLLAAFLVGVVGQIAAAVVATIAVLVVPPGSVAAFLLASLLFGLAAVSTVVLLKGAE